MGNNLFKALSSSEVKGTTKGRNERLTSLKMPPRYIRLLVNVDGIDLNLFASQNSAAQGESSPKDSLDRTISRRLLHAIFATMLGCQVENERAVLCRSGKVR